MKRTYIVISLLLLFALSACGSRTGMTEDQQFAAAQQTLEALNHGESPATEVPPTQVPPTASPPTAEPESTLFAGAVGAWESTDSDGSLQTVTFSGAGDNRFTFDYYDQGALVCGLDASGSPMHGFRVTGTGSATGGTFIAPNGTGTCDGTGEQVTADWEWTYRPDSDTLMDPASVVWNRAGTGSSASGSGNGDSGESASSTRIIDLDNDGPLWDTNCNTLRQPMAEFGEGWLEEDHLFGAGLNCDLGFDLQIAQSGTYEVYLNATYAPDFGLMRLTFSRGSQDDHIFNIALYDPVVRPTGEIPLGQWYFNADETNHFILVLYDKQPESSDYKFGLDYLKLVLVDPDF
ncbi:MAG: hypothetical protein R6X32_00275 [Chloroflexota bacterium]